MVRKKTTARKITRKAKTANEVDQFMAKLRHPLKPEIEAIRAIILASDKRINESVKWNAPSFDIRELFATFKLRPYETVQVVFHTGAKARPEVAQLNISDPSSLLKWVAKDRCLATFSDMQDIRSRGPALRRIVKQWIRQIE